MRVAGTIVFVEDEVLFVLFWARGESDIRSVGARAGLPIDRITETRLDLPAAAAEPRRAARHERGRAGS